MWRGCNWKHLGVCRIRRVARQAAALWSATSPLACRNLAAVALAIGVATAPMASMVWATSVTDPMVPGSYDGGPSQNGTAANANASGTDDTTATATGGN